VSPDIPDALVRGRTAAFDDQREQVIYEMATTLTDTRWISRTLYDGAVEVLGHDKITDAAVLMGFYTSIALTLNFYDVPAGATGISRPAVPNPDLP
jgi:4-carboxymuconolactone decarboxylase